MSLALLAATVSSAGAASLSNYTTFANHALSRTSEASGLTYNRDTGTLFVVGDEGLGVEQYTLSGGYIDRMLFDQSGSREKHAVDDAEGITYLGNNTFMIADERDMMGRVTTYEAGAKRTLAQLTPTSYAFGPSDGGNLGLEGVAYDPITGSFWGVRERSPLEIYAMAGLGGAVTQPISTRNITRMGLVQFSDIYVMAASQAFQLDDPRRMNLMVLSRGDAKILEITREGVVVDSLDLRFLGATGIEGLTMDDNGTIYLASEGTGLHVLTAAVPEPSPAVLLGLAALGFAGWRIARRRPEATSEPAGLRPPRSV